jgi:lipopolysaccharide/colanic/teichoic acid biosynthesis glycosyltransferase
MAKRALDVIIGSVLLVLAGPVIVVIAIVMAVSLRSWPFFIQDRVGRGGTLFPFLKIRTMPADTPQYSTKDALDVRLQRFAAFLRRSHLDELPQLFLVPLGWISLVGPRPKMPDEFEPVEPEYGRVRQTVPQGCTGLWQVGRDTHRLPSEAPEYDMYYAAYATVRLDVLILGWTVLSMLGLRREFGLDQVPRWAVRKRPAEFAEPAVALSSPVEMAFSSEG